MRTITLATSHRSALIDQAPDPLLGLLDLCAGQPFRARNQADGIEYTMETDGHRWVATIHPANRQPDVMIDSSWCRVVEHLIRCGLSPAMVVNSPPDTQHLSTGIVA